ncbi:Methyltransferase domain-containing protein [Shimia gijangensis]|uniref:Methyltransferase domain-containing protein n=1 Tax=Shimia gijangensis TaxID=1470563 RepID=A0A1M6HTK3_9RHOB|nr:methyltransferase domain-containing protein [Shimia gijangensis]SHJ25513.1 Methyltransferase domain-containing protein [Shimia gijangensis]
MSKTFLQNIYDRNNVPDVTELYDQWAATYEKEISGNGYATPKRCAEALTLVATDLNRPVLDFGCGTGLSGMALRLAGFRVLDGRDLSDEMLDQARAKGIYRNLKQVAPDGGLAGIAGQYDLIAAIGVIGVGAGPASLVQDLLDALPKGGLLVFSYNDHVMQDGEYAEARDAVLESGLAIERLREFGPHLPGQGLNSDVYVFEKA